MREKKYEFTGEIIEVNGAILHRIRALRDFKYVAKGGLGGFIEHEGNLSHYGDCWVGSEAKVYGEARVSEDAAVFGEASVFDSAHIYGEARVLGKAKVYGKAGVGGGSYVDGDAQVFDCAIVGESARLSGRARVYSNAHVHGHAIIEDSASCAGRVRVFGESRISSDLHLTGSLSLSTSPIIIKGLSTPIVITDDKVLIFIYAYSLEDWESGNIDDRYARQELKTYNKYKDVIHLLVKNHRENI